MSDPDDRWRLRLQSFRKALVQLSMAVNLARQRELSDLEQQGLIQAFEFTHEVAWNLLKDYLEDQGIVGIIGSKGANREAFKSGLIVNGETWMQMIKTRSQTSHTYDFDTANEISEAITSEYISEFTALERRFAELEAA